LKVPPSLCKTLSPFSSEKKLKIENLLVGVSELFSGKGFEFCSFPFQGGKHFISHASFK